MCYIWEILGDLKFLKFYKDKSHVAPGLPHDFLRSCCTSCALGRTLGHHYRSEWWLVGGLSLTYSNISNPNKDRKGEPIENDGNKFFSIYFLQGYQ